MSEKIITIKDVEYVAKLARLAISEEEKVATQQKLERILEYVSHLKEINTDNVKPTAHPVDVSNVWRGDVAVPFAHIDELFKNAPEKEETFFRVKKVIE
jgi:aspartyl-tRNA(Asn)/glutamyl-tRNA(Gln) amidotransferase subunit C